MGPTDPFVGSAARPREKTSSERSRVPFGDLSSSTLAEAGWARRAAVGFVVGVALAVLFVAVGASMTLVILSTGGVGALVAVVVGGLKDGAIHPAAAWRALINADARRAEPDA